MRKLPREPGLSPFLGNFLMFDVFQGTQSTSMEIGVSTAIKSP